MTVCGCIAVVAAPAVAQSPHTHQHSFGDAEKWAQYFDDPNRDAWQKPHEVIEALGLKPDADVADIGAGTGYFSTRLAHMVPKGRVYAVDTEPDMVKYLTERAKRAGLKNLIPVKATPSDSLLPRKVDVAIMVDVYHHIDNRTDYFRKLAGSLKPGGRVAIVDFRMDSPEGPPKEVRMPPDRIKAEMKSAGYDLVKEYDFLPKQHFLVFSRAAR
ncbi:MAG: methyltransferase domain-containing protein [Betaproteobacteria bacterium]|nr:methyltransferase domain-containing protein [Betaproteobacteria bacterium]